MNTTNYVQLENWHYIIDLCGGKCNDTWRLNGQVFNHPNFKNGDKVFVSTPKVLDEENMTLTTKSGRVYKIGRCSGNLEEQLNCIKEDIARGGTLHI